MVGDIQGCLYFSWLFLALLAQSLKLAPFAVISINITQNNGFHLSTWFPATYCSAYN